jgi:hypothetical protein
MSKEEEAAVEAETLARSTAVAFLLGCDRARYGKRIEDVENDFLQGRNNYPMTVAAAYNVVTNWKQENRFGWRAPTADGVAFANVNDAKKAPAKQRNVTWHKCGLKGHYATDCPELTDRRVGEGKSDATTLLLAGIDSGEFDSEPVNFTFTTNGYDGITCQMGQDGRLPKTWILLDNQSRVGVFYNADLPTDIRKGTGHMDIHCNAGRAPRLCDRLVSPQRYREHLIPLPCQGTGVPCDL